jgi:hypothetical protein
VSEAATPRPWTHRPNHKPYHIVVFGGRKAYEEGLTTSDILAADAALIVEAVNAYDRLRAIEVAARDAFDWLHTECYPDGAEYAGQGHLWSMSRSNLARVEAVVSALRAALDSKP